MINKLKRIKYIYQIRKLNKEKDCSISWHTAITETNFEGNNGCNIHSALNHCKVGRVSYIGYGTFFEKTKIGRFCSISHNVELVTGFHPSREFVSSSPLFYRKNKSEFGKLYFDNSNMFDERRYTDDSKDYYCEIENDVWIGANVKIISGVKIGNGAIIGMGAVVTKNVPPYAIVGGVPAKIIRYRFDEETVQKLLKAKWWNWDLEVIREKVDLFGDIKEFKKKLD